MTATLHMDEPYVIGLDVGGSKIEAVVIGRSRTGFGYVHLPMDARDEQRVLNSVENAIATALARAEVVLGQVGAVALGIPGQVEDGIIQIAVNLNLTAYPLAEILSKRLQIPVVLENDVRLAAIGAYEYLNTRQPLSSLVYLSVGTGISAGVVLDGRLLRGTTGMAGEIGHAIFDPQGPLCKCGMRGCLEALASGPAITTRAQQALMAGEAGLLAKLDVLDARAIYQAAAQGDLLSRRIVEQASLYLARAIQWMAMAYDADQIVLGGGVSHEGEGFIRPIRTELARLRAGSELARRMLPDERISLFPAEVNAGLWGAFALARPLVAA